jgi:ABC-type transport system involved in cytochrome bd biosynthesis fused ATPase/permease subunit
MDFLNKINPLNHVDSETYVRTWQYLFANLLQGFLAHFIAAVFLVLSGWFIVGRRNLPAAAAFFAVTLFFTFAAPLFQLTGLIK